MKRENTLKKSIKLDYSKLHIVCLKFAGLYTFLLIILLFSMNVNATEKQILDGSETILTSGYYVVNMDLTYTGKGTGGSGLAIANNSTVYIEISSNCTLTVNGNNASGTSGAGAGIYLPKTSTLYLAGKGTVIAKGGAAASGTTGDNGMASKLVKSSGTLYYYNESGKGGNGGGGAGAGIGTNGGTGGTGGKASGDINTRKTVSTEMVFNGISGNQGGNGANTDEAGTLYKANTITLTATGGVSGSKPTTTSSKGTNTYYVWSSDRVYYAGTSGGGGKGNGGKSGYSYGSGGGGGAGAGSGGTGGITWSQGNVSKGYNPTGGRGGDGGESSGESGSYNRNATSTVVGADGGKGGLDGTSFGSKQYITTYSITYNSNGGSYIGDRENVTTILFPTTNPEKTGYRFVGWYTDNALQNKAVTGSAIKSNITLYAKWEHVHGAWIYSLGSSNNILVATCNNNGCYEEPQKVSLSLIALAASGAGTDGMPFWKEGESVNISTSNDEDWKEILNVDKVPSIYYEGVDSTPYEKTNVKPTVAGLYKATISQGTVTASLLFEIKKYVVVNYNANGGKGTMTSIEVASGSYNLPPCTFKAPRDKEFAGWSLSPNGPKITTTSISIDGDVTLYALWEAHTHSYNTIEFTNGMTKTTCKCGYYVIRYK